LEFVIGALAVLFILLTVLGVIATVRTARAVKRGVERTSMQVRRTVEDTTLRAKTAQPGPVGEVARMRLELRASLEGTRAALDAAAGDDPSLAEAVGLLKRLRTHAEQLDGELRLLMEREPDRARVRERLPEARERVASIKESADSLRFAAQDRARQYDAESLDSLREQIDIESGALRSWQEPPAAPSAGPARQAPAGGHGAGDAPGAPPALDGAAEPERTVEDLLGRGTGEPQGEPVRRSPDLRKDP
jgi:hypothetical protein